MPGMLPYTARMRFLLLFLSALAGLQSSGAFALTPASSLRISVTHPSAGTVARGAQRVPLLHLDLQASCDGDRTVQSITLTHRGKGDARDLEGIYALQAGRRLTRAVTMDTRTGKAMLQLRAFTVPACKTSGLDVAGNFSIDAAAGGEHVLQLLESADIISDAATVTVTEARAAASAVVAPVGQGTVTVEYLSLLQTPSYGSRRMVARIRLTGDATKDQTVRRIAFTNDGTAGDTDLRNLFLESSRGEMLTAQEDRMDGRTVALTFTPPLTLRRHEQKVLILRADIRASRRRTIQFVIDEPSDIDASACIGTAACFEAH
jgi:hypothetical protein